MMEQLIVPVRQAGQELLRAYADSARPSTRSDLHRAGTRLEEIAVQVLRPALTEIRPGARWVDEDQEMTALPPGEWWAVDPVEGAVNFVHGMDQWAVTVALIRDNVPELAVVYQPVGERTWTAARGGGAFLNGRPLSVSAKQDLDAAIVTTTQPRTENRRFGGALTTVLDRALLVRATVPSTFPQLDVAEGHVDAYWQYECDLIGVAAGVLLITEAGGVVTDLHGQPWQPGSPDILAAAPGIHAELLSVLTVPMGV